MHTVNSSGAKFVLRVQLADMRQNAAALGLFSFSNLLLARKDVGGSTTVRVWRNGAWNSCDPLWVHGSVETLPSRQFNSVFLEHELAKPALIASGIELLSFSSLLTVSPTSSLWASVPNGPFREGEAESLRSYFESLEQALRYRSIASYPSLVDTQLIIRSNNLSATDCLESSLTTIAESFPPELREVPLMGVVDCSEEPDPGDLMTERFMNQSDYFRIGRCFPSLHPVLIGDYNELARMKEIVRASTELRGIGDKALNSRLGLLYLPPRTLRAPETSLRLKPWLVPEPQPIHAVGEFEVRGAKILSLKRSRELEIAGVLTPLPDGFVRYLLVSARHCEMAGVNPEDMLTYIGPASQVMKAQAEVDSQFARTDITAPLKDRIWLAYETTTFRNLSAELKGLVKQLYFAKNPEG